MENRTIDGYTFKYDSDNNMFECRGDICYDDEHDEVPEEGLWRAALKLEDILEKEGIKGIAEHSEKGWVEVQIMKETNLI
jgi:hypothetical protein